MFTYEKPDNLVSSFENTVAKWSGNRFIGEKDNKGEYQWITYGHAKERVDALRAGLAACGIGPGDKVGFIGNNRKEWALVALATYGLRGAFVPMYESELEKLWHYIVKDSALKVLVVSKPEIYEIVAPFLVTVETLQKVFIIEDDGPHALSELEAMGVGREVEPLVPLPTELANVVYTSGTTGEPKGVMLSHGNITSNSRAGWRLYPFLNENSVSISILPWAHSYGQTAELFNFIQFGGRMGIMESVKTLGADIASLRPDIIIGVPRVFNKIYDGLLKRMEQESSWKKSLFFAGIESGIRRRTLREAGKFRLGSTMKHSLLSAVVFSKVRKRFGGKVKACLTASAAIKPEVIEFFMAMGLPLYEAYGLTECSPALTMNSAENYRIGSVGKALEYIELDVDTSVIEGEGEDGEILARGPNIMLGYLNKPQETAKILNDDGWIRTGDRGYVDEDGYLFITGRIKEQYKLLNGKYVFPAALEEDIAHNPFISNAFVYGMGREYNVALVVPDFEALMPFVKKKGLPEDPAELCAQEGILSFIHRQIKKSLEGEYGHYEIPKKILLVPDPFTVENGVLTQTLKTKRRVILDRYGSQLLSLYDES